MLTKTIGQLSAATSITDDDLLEIETSGYSRKATIQQLACFAIPLGAYVDVAYQKTVSSTFPAVPLWDADHTIDEANYPLLVTDLRAASASVTLTAGTVVTTINVNATAGSILSSVDSAFTIILNALTEEYAVQGSYSIPITIGGTDYAISSMSSVITIVGTIATGATTLTVYPHRIVGSTTTAKVYKDSGRALMTHDGLRHIAGFRRRHHMQGHWHEYRYRPDASPSGAVADLFGVVSENAGYTHTNTIGAVAGPITDGVNGTPITGPETEPNSTIVYRYLWAQEYIS